MENLKIEYVQIDSVEPSMRTSRGIKRLKLMIKRDD